VEIYFKSDTIKALRKAGIKSPVFGDEGADWRDREIESQFIQADDFPLIKKIVKQPEFWAHIENKRIFRKLEAVESLKASGFKGTKIKKLDLLAEAIREVFVAEAPHKWVFVNDATYGSLVPYFMTSVRYYPPERHRDGYTPARVEVLLKAMVRGGETEKHFTFHGGELPATVEEVFGSEEAYIETPKLVADYEADVAKYQKASPRTGEQYLAHGRGYEAGQSRWHRGEISFEKDGQPSKVIMDDGIEQGKKQGLVSMMFWNKKHVKDDDAEDAGDAMIPLPVHPVVRGFNLSIHEYVDCHIANLDEYQYDEKLIEKLVLPREHKDLVDALTGGAIKRMADIIKGKAQGIIVLASGKPGTGKTLTAEVYSEAIKRPLYMVQCSQLGTDEEKLEKLLTEVLDRATRWRAILLIDESDVYIHERGDDIQQNAIVGVFLRLLEYFNGILFLTTNRETIIDDAIISRVTAHVRYDVPDNDEDKKRLWTILCTQYGVKVTTVLLNCALKEFPKISGRSIRQLIRLGKFMADREGVEVEFSHIKRASKFHDFTELDDAK
jgi:hypothetical protein